MKAEFPERGSAWLNPCILAMKEANDKARAHTGKIKIFKRKETVMKGRPPKPTKLHLINGTYRPDRMNRKNEPRPVQGKGKAPSWLKGEALKEWRRVAPELQRTGVLTAIDETLLAAYCSLVGIFIDGVKSGEPMKSSLIAQLRGLAASFGLDPSSRGRLSVPPPEPVDPMEDFLKQGRDPDKK